MRHSVMAITSSLLLVSQHASASDFGAGFLVATLGVLAIAIWPLTLPLLYLRGVNKKLRLYLSSGADNIWVLSLAELAVSAIWPDRHAIDA